MVPVNGKSTVRFSVFELDLKAGELRRNGSRIRLQEQPFQILVSLLGRPGEVVTRDELRAKLWPADTFVDFDHSLNAAIRRLRDALGDSADTPRFVETVARRGYRFIAPVANSASPSVETTAEAAGHEEEAFGRRAPEAAAPLSAPSRRLWLLGAATAVVLIGGIMLARYFVARSSAPEQISLRRLTANKAEIPVISAALSPSGKYLAFADTTGVYFRQVDNGETHPIPLPAGFAAHPVSWLPDDNHLLVATHPEHGEGPSLWKVSVMGGDPILLTDNGSAAVASPDAEQIAFIRGTRSSQEIWIMRGNGENPEVIFSCKLCLLGGLAWNPNGKQLAYVQQQYQTGSFWGFDTQLEIFSFDNHRSETLGDHVGTALAWTRDGRLFYVREEAPPNQTDANLWAIRVDASGKRSAGAPERLTNGYGLIASISASTDGKRLAILRRTLQPNVYVSEVAAHGTRISTPQVLTADEWYDFPTAWTPDSKSVLFFSDRDGVFHIFKQGIDQAKPELLVGGNPTAVLPRLSPDGTTVLYIENEAEITVHEGPPHEGSPAVQRMRRVPVNGGPPQLVLEGKGINNLQCARSPSTVCLYSQLTPGEERFYTFDPVKGKGQELPALTIRNSDYYGFNWTLSPDGKMMAFSKKLSVQDKPAIRLVSLADYHEHPIALPDWSGIATLDWSADGKSLWATAFARAETANGLWSTGWSTGVSMTGKWTLLNIDLSGKVTPVLEENKKNLGWAIPSPDGSKIALWEATGAANVWLVEQR